MSANTPRGFVESRHLTGHHSPSSRWFKVKAAGASGSHKKFPGDPVVLVSGQSVARIPAAATAAGLPIVGVIRAVYDSNKKPLTFNQPSVGGPFLPASTAGWAEVNVDPHQVYLVNTDATVVSTLIGQFVDVTANAANTAAGRSGMTVEVGTGTNSAAATAPFQVISIGPDNLDGIIGGEGNQNVEVIIARHAWANSNKVR